MWNVLNKASTELNAHYIWLVECAFSSVFGLFNKFHIILGIL